MFKVSIKLGKTGNIYFFVLTVVYVGKVYDKVIKMRQQFTTFKSARANAEQLLSKEPCTMVEKYLNGMEREPKEQVVANHKTRFSKPALPLETCSCSCKGKCATRACPCKKNTSICSLECSCNKNKCENS